MGYAEESRTDESVERIMAEPLTVSKVENKDYKESIHCRLKVTSHEYDKFEARMKLATDTGVRKTILNRPDWEKIQDKCQLVKAKLRFRPYGTEVRLPIRGRAKVQLKAKAGATFTMYVFINDSDKDTSLLGKNDAIRLGIIKINLKGKVEEVDTNGQEDEEVDTNGQEDEEVDRIKMMRLSDLKEPANKESRQKVKSREKQV